MCVRSEGVHSEEKFIVQRMLGGSGGLGRRESWEARVAEQSHHS